MIFQGNSYYRYDGAVGRCVLTSEICDISLTERGCCTCQIPNYLLWLENKVRE